MKFKEFCKEVKLPKNLEQEFKDFILEGDLFDERSFDVDDFEQEDLQSEYQEFVGDCHPELADEEDVEEEEEEEDEET